ncbi:MAG: cytochrome c oxidase assembly protein [Inhella sp.]|uniref:cytochrome c oxidase assembly protein n=1 Tax=Inhella sp. TaxID=1921806 RepID=UPI0022C0C788|nr:cytochrome c oxidase assembly protein [Inhella sp.]MCZ8236540.1 cytochrome c oxidase assembly protein [Inhella sp.]
MSQWRRALHRDNLHLVGKLVLVCAMMFGFGYALVPLYRAICEALGINVLSETERRDQVKNTQVDTTRLITVEFDANARGPWDFKPAKNYVQVHPGELVTVNYTFRNRQDRTMAAQAIPSYAPKQSMAHFHKFECFCFNEYTLAPGEEKEWPVVFVVDPKLPKDVKTITLSYTFFEVPGKKLARGPSPAVSAKGGA